MRLVSSLKRWLGCSGNSFSVSLIRGTKCYSCDLNELVMPCLVLPDLPTHISGFSGTWLCLVLPGLPAHISGSLVLPGRGIQCELKMRFQPHFEHRVMDKSSQCCYKDRSTMSIYICILGTCQFNQFDPI